MSGPTKGITADRKSVEKLSFIIDNFSTLTRPELAAKLNESPRWIKRQISILKKKGFLENKREIKEETIWSEEMTKIAVDLRINKLMYSEEISKVLKEQHNFDALPHTIEYHLINKVDCKFPSKEEWLYSHLSYDYAKKLIEDGNRISDISNILNKELGVYISDDIILTYIKKIGLVSLRKYLVNEVSNKFDTIDKDWLDDKIKSKISMKGLCEEIGISSTVVKRKFKENNLEILDDRRLWSKNLEYLRDYLLNLPKPSFELSQEERHQCILGWLAGDGHLDEYGRFVTNHSLKQLSYLYLKRQVLYNSVSNIVTVPASHFSSTEKLMIFGGIEQLGISCPNIGDYNKYINENGTKNLEKIFSELTELGWACYYMDDGFYFGSSTDMSMKKEYISKFENRYIFREKLKLENESTVRVEGINPKYLIPCMADKVPDASEVGSFWKQHLPELFDVKVENDFDLCLINSYIAEKYEYIWNRVTEYYQKRGFPYFNINEDYLNKEYESMCELNTSYIWKNNNVIRYLSAGNKIFKNFMPHMVESKYKGVSPFSTFNNFTALRSALIYTYKANKTILPDFLYKSLVYFNGGVTGFPCSVAKAIVERYSKVGDTVVDPCAGWGGRLLGTVSANRNYCGFEPWDKTAKGLNSIIDYYGLKDKAHIINSDFYLNTAPVACDLIMTSPPYIDLEVYGKPMDKNQWETLIKNIFIYAEKALKSKGYFVLNIPRYLKEYLPKTTLLEKDTMYWFTSTRRKDITAAEVLLVWQKI
jgi:hypothetical protein